MFSTVECVLWYSIQGDVPHACSVRREGSAICLHTFQVIRPSLQLLLSSFLQAGPGHCHGGQAGMPDDDGQC